MKKPILTALLFLSCYCFIHAQDKLPSVQKGSFRAPAGIHIDGSLEDWKDSLRAYNRNTKIYYLLANDDKYLYLAVRASDATTKAKIAAGGITLLINTAGKKKEQDAFSLTYPVITRTAGRGGRRGGGGASALSDSASKQQLISAAKEIKVIGFKDVDDTLISIYNEYSIKVAIGFDLSSNYCYELAVPLKLLGLNADDAKEVAYNIKLNGLQTAMMKMISISADGGGGGSLTISGLDGGGGFRSSSGGSRGGGGGGGKGGRGGGGGAGVKNTIDYQDLTSPTDFWGNYALAKK